jgi:hypothetical protein
MKIKCLFGRHSYGRPRANGDGTVSHECMACLHIDRAPVTLPNDEGAAVALEARRAQAIADLVAAGRWVGIPEKPRGDAKPNPTTGVGTPVARIRLAGPRAA